MLRNANLLFVVAVFAVAGISTQQRAEGQKGAAPAPGGTNPGTATPSTSPALPQGASPGNNIPGGTIPGGSPALPQGASPGNNTPGGTIPGGNPAFPQGTYPGNTNPARPIPGGNPAFPQGTYPGNTNPARPIPGGNPAFPQGTYPGNNNPAQPIPGTNPAFPQGTFPNNNNPSATNPGNIQGTSPGNPNGAKPGTPNNTPTMIQGTPGATNAWFGNQNVQKQLNLGNNQLSELHQAYGNAFTAYQQAVTGLDKSLTPQQRFQRMQELQQKFYKNYSDSIGTIIPNPQARSRYEQLHLQFRGVGAFNDPIIQNKLLLTDAQRQQFSKYNSEWLNNMGELYRAYQTDPQDAAARFDLLHAQAQQQMYRALTPQQRQLWYQMRGLPYDFQTNLSQSYPSVLGQ